MKVGLLALYLMLAPQVQLVHIGRISKIDVKAGVITIRERLYPERGSRGRGAPRPPGLGADFPPDIPPTPSRGRGRREIETRVVYNSDTVFAPSGVSGLKVGDAIQVTAKPQKADVLATRIEKIGTKP